MFARSFGIGIAVFLAAAGAVHCTSAQTEPSASHSDTAAVAERADSELTTASAPARSAARSASKSNSAPASSSSDSPRPAPETASSEASAASRLDSSFEQSTDDDGPIVGPIPEDLDELTRATLEIEQTDRALAAVRTKAERSTNRRARQDIESAVQRQAEARESLEQSFFARASRLTIEARDLAQKVAVHLGPPEEDPDFVSTMLGRTDDALGRAKEIIESGGGPSEKQRLKSLEADQKEARSLFKDGEIRASYEATRTVRDGVLTLLRQCEGLPVPASTAERAMKRAARALELVEPELGDPVTTAARRLVREARDQMTKARVSFARKNYRDTLLHSKLVERKLELALAAQRSAMNRSG